MEVLYYRDCRSYHQYKIAHVNKHQTNVLGPINTEQNWEFAKTVSGYA